MISPEVAVGVEEEVRGLEVAVEHVGRVDVLQSPVKKGEQACTSSFFNLRGL